MTFIDKDYFKKISGFIFSSLLSDELMTTEVHSEETLFVRINQGKIRQPSFIKQAKLNFTLYNKNKSIESEITLCGQFELDFKRLSEEVANCREWLKSIPADPYIVLPVNGGNSDFELNIDLPKDEFLIDEICNRLKGYDFAGLLTSGYAVRGNTNSLGQFHWFKTGSYYFDYSIYNSQQKAVKGLIANQKWNETLVENNIKYSLEKLERMSAPAKMIERGAYDIYLEPSAVYEILGILNWEGLSMGSHKRGNCSLKELWEGKKNFSPLFSYYEDFSLGLQHRFNEIGEIAPEKMAIIENGKFQNFFTSARTAKEFSIKSNNASSYESSRSTVIAEGSLKQSDILAKLGKGIYISNLHYLNWSDRGSARITGMTRYACFWVENGKIIAPIKDLRFDETLYHIFGSGLEAITNFSEIIPATGSYGEREIGGCKLPGMLIRNFNFTL